mgnify:CR=1 FL=1
MPKLSRTQSTLLRTAASRRELSLMPIPDTIRLRGAALERTLRALLDRGLIVEDKGDAESGRGEEMRRQLVITPAGLAAIGRKASDPAPIQRGAALDATPSVSEARPPARPGGKLGALLDAVANPKGATLDELAMASGRLPHTTRAALTRLRQRGFDVRLVRANGRKTYRLVSAG